MDEAMKWPDVHGKAHQRPIYATLKGADAGYGDLAENPHGWRYCVNEDVYFRIFPIVFNSLAKFICGHGFVSTEKLMEVGQAGQGCYCKQEAHASDWGVSTFLHESQSKIRIWVQGTRAQTLSTICACVRAGGYGGSGEPLQTADAYLC